MTGQIGFVLLTHRNPLQILRLIKSLNRMFDNPKIACHHDFSQCSFPIDLMPENVLFVRPHFNTTWGHFSLVDAMLAALRLLYSDNDQPDRFVLLSGQCYPIKNADTIISALKQGNFDAQIGYYPIVENKLESTWQKKCFLRYCAQSPFYPFSDSFECFAGEHWFSGNHVAANALLRFHSASPALAEHYRFLGRDRAITPAESYYQTILCNDPKLKILNDDLRYIDWPEGSWHPKTLTLDDSEELFSSHALFARKFELDESGPLLDEIDNRLFNG